MKNILILFNYNLFLSIKIFSKMSKYQNTIMIYVILHRKAKIPL